MFCEGRSDQYTIRMSLVLWLLEVKKIVDKVKVKVELGRKLISLN